MDDDEPQDAVAELRVALTRYLAQHNHLAVHSGADPELVGRLRSRITWPASTAELREASRLIPAELVHSVAAAGTTSQVVEKLESYLAAGCSEVVVSPFGSGRRTTLESLSRALSRRAR